MTTIYSDGGCLGNGTERGAMYGSFMVEGEKEPHKLTFGFGTNNRAEYLTLIAAMEYAANNNLPEIEMLIDSKLVHEQIWGNWRIRSEELAALNHRAKQLVQQNKICARRISGIEMKRVLGH